ncbi:helix-turn-helix domain-containing protein [Desulforamulus aquiferis]|uniref:Helix-turn-helix transcriptional regulator n=1 Tax=Desulforamulus aquiferis TaxID=1397668 RepID=A0AAW7Z818_9FIRM|nr:helix-turn-helix transcriptional regulator [Desulforamulus aquiferis]MDO7785632.1 helix-turn-helix transcriptional regulator [Desulforamulus aquiferis]RYD03218.1 XRE family transcriptional regulator [Desulforamulus aquiferis]
MYSPKELGLRVKRAREHRAKRSGQEFTQKMLAFKIGETSKWVQKVEKGLMYPEWEPLNLIADTCGVSIDFITGESFESEIDYEESVRGGVEARKISTEDLYV